MKRFSLCRSTIFWREFPPWLPPNQYCQVVAFPSTLANMRYVYVACYDGDQFNPNLFSEDRNAIGDVQSAIQKRGKLANSFQFDESMPFGV